MMGKNFDDLASIKEAESSVKDEIIIDAKGLGHKGKSNRLTLSYIKVKLLVLLVCLVQDEANLPE